MKGAHVHQFRWTDGHRVTTVIYDLADKNRRTTFLNIFCEVSSSQHAS